MSQIPAFAHNPLRAVPTSLAGAMSHSPASEARSMSVPDQERWMRVKQRLRAAVGDDNFKSWFAAMELCAVDGETVRLSVPTRFLKSWVQSHYADRLLAAWKDELPVLRRVEITH